MSIEPKYVDYVKWRVPVEVLHEWCAWQIERRPHQSLYLEAVLRMIASKVWPMATEDTGGGRCS